MKEVSQNMCKGFKQVHTHLYWFDNDNKTGLERATEDLLTNMISQTTNTTHWNGRTWKSLCEIKRTKGAILEERSQVCKLGYLKGGRFMQY
jgi:hypothetical protein